jgi:WD40 repeat protein
VVFSPDGRWLASGAKDNTIKIWDVSTGRLLRTLYGHGAAVNALTVSPDGKLLASGSGNTYDVRYSKLFFGGGQIGGLTEDTSVRLWDVATGRQLQL